MHVLTSPRNCSSKVACNNLTTTTGGVVGPSNITRLPTPTQNTIPFKDCALQMHDLAESRKDYHYVYN